MEETKETKIMQTLRKKISISGSIELLTGMHIGGTNAAMSIGGVDKTVIRNPLNGKPYIPGSSLKGKMRSLLELTDGNLGDKPMGGGVEHGPSLVPDSRSGRLFGTALETRDNRQRPSRLLVRDAQLLSDDSLFINTDMPYTETKTEVVIDRVTAKAMPRQNERVPAGAEFALDLILNVFDEDAADELVLIKDVLECLQLVQDDYLGGHGSRGYGKVKFRVNAIKSRSNAYYQGQELEVDMQVTIPDALR